jgi:HAE1 family hydrophobic/amphiphilic exporter-1
VASGAGQAGRRSVGTTIIGGMLVSTILNLFFIPVLYVMMEGLLGVFSRKKPTPQTVHAD